MGFDVSGLREYVKENEAGLIAKAILGARYLSIGTDIQEGVKKFDTINTLSDEVIFRLGACGFTAAGDTTFSQQIMEVATITLDKDWCLKDLNGTFLEKTLPRGTYADAMPGEIENVWADYFSGLVAKEIEAMVIKGDKDLSSGNLSLIDGLLKRLSEAPIDGGYAGVVIDGNTAGLTALDASNIIAAINAIIATQHVDTLEMDDVQLQVGYDVFRLYTQALKALDPRNYNIDGNEDAYRIFIYGTNVELVAYKGFNNTNEMLLTSVNNVVTPTDLESDFEDWRVGYDEKEDKVWLKIMGKIGGAYLRFPEMASHFKLALS